MEVSLVNMETIQDHELSVGRVKSIVCKVLIVRGPHEVGGALHPAQLYAMSYSLL